MEREQIVEALHATLQESLRLNEELRELDRTTVGASQPLNFAPLSRDQVERWYAHTQAVAAGRTATL